MASRRREDASAEAGQSRKLYATRPLSPTAQTQKGAGEKLTLRQRRESFGEPVNGQLERRILRRGLKELRSGNPRALVSAVRGGVQVGYARRLKPWSDMFLFQESVSDSVILLLALTS